MTCSHATRTRSSEIAEIFDNYRALLNQRMIDFWSRYANAIIPNCCNLR
ncbi:MAG: hypothetical protein F6J90_00600 [Moorea sp. SIOASIH]|nr:hypothetical protein [Moorena sp. SIOASIH]NEO34883.1 hypothetical protein [Moorena sp. SIOASIH]